jgi:hypothetical protein
MVSFSFGMAFLSIWLLSGALFFGANGRAARDLCAAAPAARGARAPGGDAGVNIGER